MESNKNIFHKIGDILNNHIFKIIVAIIGGIIGFDVLTQKIQLFHYPNWVRLIYTLFFVSVLYLSLVNWLFEKVPLLPVFLLGSLGAFAISGLIGVRYSLLPTSEWSNGEFIIFIFLMIATIVFTLAFMALIKYLNELMVMLEKQNKD